MSKAPKPTKVAQATGISHLANLAHAKLSASGSKKWLTCTPSAHLEAQMPDEDSKYSAEGTFAHSVFEHRLLAYLGRAQHVASEELIDGHELYWSQSLSEAVQDAVEVTIGHIDQARKDCKDPVILLEQRLDFSPWVPEGFGTGDVVIITDTYTKVLDYKNGSGVYVDAQDNSQFRLYHLGAHNTYGHLYDTKTAIGTVLQPRLNNYGSEEIALGELLQWAQDVVVPKAKLAWAGEGEFVPGEHCSSGFCRARFTCAARANHNLAIAQADFALTEPQLLTDEQIVAVLAKADQATKWLNDVQSHALAEAKRGRVFEGYKLVEGRSNRKYIDPDAVATALLAEGIPEAIIYERSLLGISAMEKALGKKRFAELLDGFIVKPSGAPALVPVSDKREAINSTASAIADFS